MLTRAQFLKNLIGFYGLSAFSVDLAVEYQKIYLLQFFVRGFQYYEGPDIIRQINREGLVDLVREPDNLYDENAIAIYFEGHKIGYVPRETNLVLSNILDADLLDLQAEITFVEPDAATWEQISVAIYALKEKTKDLPEHLTTIETPEYYTIKKDEDTYQRIYDNSSEDVMNAEDFFTVLLANSEDDGVFDLMQSIFENEQDMNAAIEQRRLVVDKNKVSSEDLREFSEKINEQILELENVFKEDGYVVVNVNKIAQIPSRIENIVKITDEQGRAFFEVIIKP